MKRKYEITEETRTFNNGKVLLHRIKALRDFGDVRKGELGGWIEKEENLSHEGNCWISYSSSVHDDAVVSGNAIVKDSSVVGGNAKVYGNAKITRHSIVCNYAEVYDDAKVMGYSIIKDNVRVYGDAIVINGCEVYGSSKLFGDACVCGHFTILHDAYISSKNDFVVIGPVYVHKSDIRDVIRFIAFYKTESGDIRVSYYETPDSCSNFYGSIDEFEQHIIHEYNYNFTLDKSDYQMWSNIIASAHIMLKGNTVLDDTKLNESSHDKSVTFDGIIDTGTNITLHDLSQEEINGIRKFIEALGNDKHSYVDGGIYCQ